MSKYQHLSQEPDAFADQNIELSELRQSKDQENPDYLDFEAQSGRTGTDDESTTSQDRNGTSSMRMAFMNMANSILGAGIIGQPFAFKNSGLIGGCLVMVLLTVLIDWTLRLIVINADLSKTRTYQDTVKHCYGRWGRLLLLFSISSFSYGGCMAASVILGDTIPHVFKSALPSSWSLDGSPVAWFFNRNFIITLFTAGVSYPLSLNRDISKLAKASAFALFGMLIIVILAVVRGPFAESSLKTPLLKLQWTFNKNIFQGISVISFALVCHHNTIFIYNLMRNASVPKFSKLTHYACGISMVFCLFMGISGLLNFGDNTKGNILNNFRSNDSWINVARFCFGLNMLTTFPLEIFVVRDVIRDIIVSWSVEASESNDTEHLELSKKQHFFITTFLVFTAMSVALLTCNLGMILELIGATSASLMAYIIPPLCYLKLVADRDNFRSMERLNRNRFLLQKALPTIVCVVFGFAVMIISSTATIKTSLSSDKEADHCVID